MEFSRILMIIEYKTKLLKSYRENYYEISYNYKSQIID